MKRALSLLLAIVLVMTCGTWAIFAAEEDTKDTGTATPVIRISGLERSYEVGDTFSATATVTGNQSKIISYKWDADGGQYITLTDDTTAKVKGRIEIPDDPYYDGDEVALRLTIVLESGDSFEKIAFFYVLAPDTDESFEDETFEELQKGETLFGYPSNTTKYGKGILQRMKDCAKPGAKVVLLTGNANITFDPNKLNLSKITNGFAVGSCLAAPEDAEEYGIKVEEGFWIDFFHSGPTPAPMTIEVPDFGGEYKNPILWRYNPSSHRMDQMATKATWVEYGPEGGGGLVSFTLDHFSAYMITQRGVDPNPTPSEPSIPVDPEKPSDGSNNSTGSGSSSSSGGSRSGGGSGGSRGTYSRNSVATPNASFWNTVVSKIRKAEPGETVRVSAVSYKEMPETVMAALRTFPNVSLEISISGGRKILIPAGGALARKGLQNSYPFSALLEHYGTAAPASDSGSRAYSTGKVNPGTGAF